MTGRVFLGLQSSAVLFVFAGICDLRRSWLSVYLGLFGVLVAKDFYIIRLSNMFVFDVFILKNN